MLLFTPWLVDFVKMYPNYPEKFSLAKEMVKNCYCINNAVQFIFESLLQFFEQSMNGYFLAPSTFTSILLDSCQSLTLDQAESQSDMLIKVLQFHSEVLDHCFPSYTWLYKHNKNIHLILIHYILIIRHFIKVCCLKNNFKRSF